MSSGSFERIRRTGQLEALPGSSSHGDGEDKEAARSEAAKTLKLLRPSDGSKGGSSGAAQAIQLMRSKDPPTVDAEETTRKLTAQRQLIQSLESAAETLRLTGSWDSLIRSAHGSTPRPKIFTSAHFAAGAAEDGSVQAAEGPTDEEVIGSLIEERYQILDVIGKGGMSVVYLGEQVSTGALVAVKRIKVSCAEDIMRFAREIKSHSRLKHKNIVAYLEFLATSTGEFFLIMERIKGLSLLDVIRSITRIDDPQNIAGIMSQACDALSYAHRNGVIHRDLKSSNIILVKEDEGNDIVVKILDFGIARMEGEERITLTGRAVGSPLYMSPEQCRGEVLTARSDIYSLGVVAYELVTGKPPYNKGSVRDIMRAHCDPYNLPQPIGAFVSNIFNAGVLNDIIFRCLETEPSKRWQSAEQLKKAFEFWYASCERGMELDGLPPEMMEVAEGSDDEPRDYSLSHEERRELRSLKRTRTMQTSFGSGAPHETTAERPPAPEEGHERTLRNQQIALEKEKRLLLWLQIASMIGGVMILCGFIFMLNSSKPTLPKATPAAKTLEAPSTTGGATADPASLPSQPNARATSTANTQSGTKVEANAKAKQHKRRYRLPQ